LCDAEHDLLAIAKCLVHIIKRTNLTYQLVMKGAPGRSGVPGRSGAIGFSGWPGQRGYTGATGPRGGTGTNGATGFTGLPGICPIILTSSIARVAGTVSKTSATEIVCCLHCSVAIQLFVVTKFITSLSPENKLPNVDVMMWLDQNRMAVKNNTCKLTCIKCVWA